MRLMLIVVAILAALNWTFGTLQMLFLSVDGKATTAQTMQWVFYVGLSALVFVAAGGLASVISRLNSIISESQSLRTAIERLPSASVEQGAALSEQPLASALRDKATPASNQINMSTIAPIAALIVVAVVGVIYASYPKQIGPANAQPTSAVLTWTCPDGSMHISRVQPANGCVGR